MIQFNKLIVAYLVTVKFILISVPRSNGGYPVIWHEWKLQTIGLDGVEPWDL